jgi:hypothetical protein
METSFTVPAELALLVLVGLLILGLLRGRPQPPTVVYIPIQSEDRDQLGGCLPALLLFGLLATLLLAWLGSR